MISWHFLKELVRRIWWKIQAVFLLPEHFFSWWIWVLLKKEWLLMLVPRGVLQISSAGMIEGFFWVQKFWFQDFFGLFGEYFLGIFRVIWFNAFWKFLTLTNPPWDFLGGLGFVGIFLRFWFVPPFDHPCHLTSGVPHLVSLGKGWRKSWV